MTSQRSKSSRFPLVYGDSGAKIEGVINKPSALLLQLFCNCIPIAKGPPSVVLNV